MQIELLSVLDDFTSGLDSAESALDSVLERLEGNELPTKQGISLLQTKAQLMVEYVECLAVFSGLKLQGCSIGDSEAGRSVVQKLLENRIMLEKMLPIEKKLKYQIDRLLRSSTVEAGSSSALKFGPNPDLIVSSSEAANADSGASMAISSGEQERAKKEAAGIYVPPRNRMVEYEEEERREKEVLKAKEKLKKKAKSSEIVQALREEFTDAPIEEKVYGVDQRFEIDDDEEDRRRYEEDNFTRLLETKKDKAKRKAKRIAASRIDAWDDFDAFDDLADTMHKMEKNSQRIDFDNLEKDFSKGGPTTSLKRAHKPSRPMRGKPNNRPFKKPRRN
jgi:hypothetical protein